MHSPGDMVKIPTGEVGSVVMQEPDGRWLVNRPKEGEHPFKPGVIIAWCEHEIFEEKELEWLSI